MENNFFQLSAQDTLYGDTLGGSLCRGDVLSAFLAIRPKGGATEEKQEVRTNGNGKVELPKGVIELIDGYSGEPTLKH